MSSLRTVARTLLPEGVRRHLRERQRPAAERGREEELGAFVLAAAAEFSAERGGDASALRSTVLLSALHERGALKQFGETHQLLQTALTPSYEANLYEYYRQQQYVMLATFLSYPYRGPGGLDGQLRPYEAGGRMLDQLDVLDYGSGMPYGLINLARTQPDRIRSVTLVDLDLIHADLAAFILRRLLSPEKVRVFKTTDPQTPPDLAGLSFNFCYGKDIFEHLAEPEPHLRNIIAHCAGDAACFFDFTDHGERYLQHISPLLSPLREVMAAAGFEPQGMINGMSIFSRGAVRQAA